MFPVCGYAGIRGGCMKRTFCKGCAHLFYTDKPGFVPLCTLNAHFIYGPLRSEIDVARVSSAEAVNVDNGCAGKSLFSRNSRRIQAFLLRRLNDGESDADTVRRSELKNENYSFKTERQNWIKLRSNTKEEIPAEEESHAEEAVDDDGGINDSIGTETSDQE